MKKIIADLVFVAVIVSLFSCGALKDITKLKDAAESIGDAAGEAAGDAVDNAADGKSDETESEVDFNSIYSGNGDSSQVLGKMSGDEKQQIIAQGKLAGVDISFGDDGSATLKYQDGTILNQSADGTWTISNSEGVVGQVGGGWPDNEFTQLLPAPELGDLSIAVTENDTFSASFDGTDVAQIKAFVEKAIEKGFSVEPETYDVAGDDAAYSYTAKNADGWCLTATSTGGQNMISLTKPAN